MRHWKKFYSILQFWAETLYGPQWIRSNIVTSPSLQQVTTVTHERLHSREHQRYTITTENNFQNNAMKTVNHKREKVVLSLSFLQNVSTFILVIHAYQTTHTNNYGNDIILYLDPKSSSLCLSLCSSHPTQGKCNTQYSK